MPPTVSVAPARLTVKPTGTCQARGCRGRGARDSPVTAAGDLLGAAHGPGRTGQRQVVTIGRLDGALVGPGGAAVDGERARRRPQKGGVGMIVPWLSRLLLLAEYLASRSLQVHPRPDGQLVGDRAAIEGNLVVAAIAEINRAGGPSGGPGVCGPLA